MTSQQIVALYDLLHAGTKMTVIYLTGGTEPKERTIRPLKVWHTDNVRDANIGRDLFSAHDSIRPGAPTFRVDWIKEVKAIYR
jgi:hypothetical protein